MQIPGYHRPCPVCQQETATPLFEKGPLKLARCPRCGMIYANPVNPELASGAYYDRLGRPFYLSPDKLESDYAPVRFERELKIFRRFCSSGAVLDVGCSTGAFLCQLTRRFPGQYQVCGSDVASAALDYAESQGVPVIRASFLEHDFQGHTYAAITFWAVMEHLCEPAKFLRKAIDLLAPGGHLFILVPNWRSLAIRWLGCRYRYIYPDHVNYFSAATLRKFVEPAAQGEVIEMGSTHFNPLVMWQDWRSPVDRVPDEERARLLKRTTSLKQNPLLKPLILAYGWCERFLSAWNLADNIYLVWRKPTPRTMRGNE